MTKFSSRLEKLVVVQNFLGKIPQCFNRKFWKGLHQWLKATRHLIMDHGKSTWSTKLANEGPWGFSKDLFLFGEVQTRNSHQLVTGLKNPASNDWFWKLWVLTEQYLKITLFTGAQHQFFFLKMLKKTSIPFNKRISVLTVELFNLTHLSVINILSVKHWVVKISIWR